MIQKPKHFDLEELVCPHVYYRFGEMAWQFFDPRILELWDWVRDNLGPVYINNWAMPQWINSPYVKFIREKVKARKPIYPSEEPVAPTALFSQRGLRCNICNLAYAATRNGVIYVSPHFLGKAGDGDVQGKTAEQVRQWLRINALKIPYPIRLERDVTWVHMDCEDTGQKVFLFNP